MTSSDKTISAAARFSFKCITDEVPGENDIGRATKHPTERDLHRRSAKTRGSGRQGRRLQRIETAERKERHIGRAVACQIVDQRVVVAVRQVVIILHANDLANLASFRICVGVTLLSPM